MADNDALSVAVGQDWRFAGNGEATLPTSGTYEQVLQQSDEAFFGSPRPTPTPRPGATPQPGSTPVKPTAMTLDHLYDYFGVTNSRNGTGIYG